MGPSFVDRRLQTGVIGGALASVPALGGSPACLSCPTLEPVCKVFFNAAGIDGEGEVIAPLIVDDVDLVIGCLCLGEDRRELLLDGDPESLDYQLLELDTEVRAACLEAADDLGLVEHNCLSAPRIDDVPFVRSTNDCPENCGE